MSEEEKKDRHGLRLIHGGGSGQVVPGRPRIVVAPQQSPPFEVDAVVIEDDTYFVLGADPQVRAPTEHPVRLWQQVHEAVPAELGSVHLAGGRPMRLLAVVHDLSADPTWRDAWVSHALSDVIRYAAEEEMTGLGLQILGAVHGKLPAARFLKLLRERLEEQAPPTLERIWLVSKFGRESELERKVRECFRDPAPGPE